MTGPQPRPRSRSPWLERLRESVLRRPLPSDVGEPTDLDRRMMARALDQAERAAAVGEVPIGSVVYGDGEILGEAHNRREAPPDPTGHAELLALREAATRRGQWRLDDCTLVVTLEPCPMCAGALVNARVRRLVFGATDPKAGAVVSLYALVTDPRLNHRIEVVRDLFADEAANRLTRFFRSRRGR